MSTLPSLQVGLLTFSTHARLEFDLDAHSDFASLQNALDDIPYRGGWTATAWALFWARIVLQAAPYNGVSYGARPESLGIPRIAVLITDGRSNLNPIEPHATLLRLSGVQVRESRTGHGDSRTG